MFASNPLLSTTSTNWVPQMCMYDESNDMTLLWSKTFEIPDLSIYQISMSPNGLKLVI